MRKIIKLLIDLSLVIYTGNFVNFYGSSYLISLTRPAVEQSSNMDDLKSITTLKTDSIINDYDRMRGKDDMKQISNRIEGDNDVNLKSLIAQLNSKLSG